MGITEDILDLFSEKYGTYKGIPVNFLGLPTFLFYKPQTRKNALVTLKKKGWLKKQGNEYVLTVRGEYFKKLREEELKDFSFNFPKNAPKNLMVMYDIPEATRSQRDWLRSHLRKFGYIMIQQSVWVGPSPLPKEFSAYSKSIGLKNNIKTFKLAKPYSSKSTKI